MNLEQLEAYRASEPLEEHNGVPLETWEKHSWPSDALHGDLRLAAMEAQAVIRALKYAQIHDLHLFRDEMINDSDDQSTSYRAWFRPKTP